MARPDTKLRFDTGWQYAPAPESTDHARIDPQYGLFIDGSSSLRASGRRS